MDLCFTGHRPDKLYGYTPDIRYKKLKEVTEEVYRLVVDNYEVKNVFTGGALGFDFMCFSLGEKIKKEKKINNILCLPCRNQGSNWYDSSKKKLELYKQQADKVHYVDELLRSENAHIAKKMQDRNEFMVDLSEVVITCWDGVKQGGTYNCIKYANKRGRDIYVINPHTFKVDAYIYGKDELDI